MTKCFFCLRITKHKYFSTQNYMKKQALQESSPKKNKAEQEKEEKEEKDKAKNLVNYAQKHQQTKESHKPGKPPQWVRFSSHFFLASLFSLFTSSHR